MAGGSATHRTACTGHRGSIYGALSDLVVVLSVPLPVVRVQSSRLVQAMAFERRPGTGTRSLLSGADPTEEIQAFRSEVSEANSRRAVHTTVRLCSCDPQLNTIIRPRSHFARLEAYIQIATCYPSISWVKILAWRGRSFTALPRNTPKAAPAEALPTSSFRTKQTRPCLSPQHWNRLIDATPEVYSRPDSPQSISMCRISTQRGMR